MAIFLLSSGGFFLVSTLTLLGCQRKLIYYPHGYSVEDLKYLPASMKQLEFKTSQGKQVAFYLPAQESLQAIPKKLWVVFNGNGTAALDWLTFLETPPDGESAFLLIDYPGYGISEGNPSRSSIHESVDGAYQALLRHLQADEQDLRGRVGILCHSLGCAVGLEFATRQKAEKAIFLSPFTKLEDVARGVVGWPLCKLLADRFDNRARLEELKKSGTVPEIHVYHGTADNVVPVRLGRQLAKEFADIVEFTEIPNVDHVWIIDAAKEKFYPVMRRPFQ